MTSPEITVIVTNYNHSAYIKQAVNSIQNQSYEDFEILIVDDASTDDSRDVISDMLKEDKQLRALSLDKNKGKWFALNTAIQHAKGKLITLQDADDASARDRLLRQWQTLTDNGSMHNLCGFTHCYSQEDMDKAASSVIPISNDVMSHADVTKMVHTGVKTAGINHYFVGHDYEIHGASSLFYKQLWTYGMKFMPGNMGLRCQLAEDGDHNTKMTLLLQKTSVLKEPLYCYRRNTSTNDAYREGL